MSDSTAGTISGPPATLFEAAAKLLRDNIRSGHLTAGLVLQESALSERLSMSRATVKRALSMLEQEGLVRRFTGRGFLVTGKNETPRRVDLRRLDLDLEGLEEMLGQPNWQRIYREIEAELSRSLIFGHYRVIEAMIAQEFDVSRTVVRDVLGRLQERGLVQKSQTSRWIVEPLTAQRIKDKFELRSVLEVAALKSGSFHREPLEDFVAEVRALDRGQPLSPETWLRLDTCFFENAILSTPNRDLADFAASNRRTIEASQMALFSIGLPPDAQSLLELCTVVDLLFAGSLAAAANMLTTHLENGLKRTIAQLKITAIIDAPPDLAPYLVPTDPPTVPRHGGLEPADTEAGN